MFAIFTTGGKQYKVSKGDVIRIEKLPEGEGEKVVFPGVFLTADEKKGTQIGKPYVEGASVEGKVVAQGKADKIRVVKFQAKKRSKSVQGHRQRFTEVEITAIKAGGSKKAPATKKEAAAK